MNAMERLRCNVHWDGAGSEREMDAFSAAERHGLGIFSGREAWRSGDMLSHMTADVTAVLRT